MTESGERPPDGGNTEALLSLFRQAGHSVANSEITIQSLETFVGPLGRYLREKKNEKWHQRMLDRMAAGGSDTGFSKQDVDDQYVKTVDKPGRTVIVLSNAEKWNRCIPRQVPGGQGFDLTAQQLGLINTYDNVMSILGKSSNIWLLNDIASEKGSISAALPSPADLPDAYSLAYATEYMKQLNVPIETKISVGVSKFVFVDPEKAYTVIDPLYATIKLLGPRLSEAMLAGLGYGLHNVVGEAPRLAEKVKAAADDIDTVGEKVQEAAELVRGKAPEGAIKIKNLFCVRFYATGFTEPPNSTTVYEAFTCRELFDINGKAMCGIPLGETVRTIRAAMEGLMG